MSNTFVKIGVPGSRGYAAKVAEEYFVSRLTTRYAPLGYACYREYEYAGGSTFFPTAPSAGHTNPQLDRILRMLQGDAEESTGFTHLPKIKKKTLKTGGHQKPDFLAFRANDGVVAEVGTSDMRVAKQHQLAERLRALRELVNEEMAVQQIRSMGKPLPWHGMTWKATDYLPEEGPVMIPVSDSEIVSTAPTWESWQPGVYLYSLYRYERHRQPVGVPFTVPTLSPQARQQISQAIQELKTDVPSTSNGATLDKWPALRDELVSAAKKSGPIIAIGAFVIAAALLAPEAAIVGATAAVVATIDSKTPDQPGT